MVVVILPDISLILAETTSATVVIRLIVVLGELHAKFVLSYEMVDRSMY